MPHSPPLDGYPAIPQGDHIIVKAVDGRWIAVATRRKRQRITAVTVGAGSTREEAVADCKTDLANNPQLGWRGQL